jgi:hypothetical protein
MVRKNIAGFLQTHQNANVFQNFQRKEVYGQASEMISYRL